MNAAQLIASKFNVLESAVVRVEEWKNCLFAMTVQTVAEAEAIARQIAPRRTISCLNDGRVIVRRSSEEEDLALAEYGFVDGVWKASNEAVVPEKSLAEKYEDAKRWTSDGNHLNIDFVRELKAAGFNVAALGYGHV